MKLILAPFGPSTASNGWRWRTTVALAGQLSHVLLNLPITVCQHLLILPVGFQGLAQSKQVLGAIVANQRLDHRCPICVNPPIGQLGSIPFSSKDGVQNAQSALTRNIA